MKPTTAWYKTAAIIATLMFILMAALQLNDPDPLYWFLVYAAVAVIAAAGVVGRRLPRFALVTFGAVIAGVLIAAPGFVDYLQFRCLGQYRCGRCQCRRKAGHHPRTGKLA